MEIALPLTAFEEFLLRQGRPAYPCSGFARFQFQGRIDREAFVSAVRTVMPRHPLLRSSVEMQGYRPYWKSHASAMPRIEWHVGQTGAALPSSGYQDLRQDIGLRLFVVENGDRCDVTAQFNHACCDGMGIQVFGNDLLIAYALLKGSRSHRLRLPRFDPHRLATRSRFGLASSDLIRMLPGQMLGLVGAGHFFFRAPTPVLPHAVSADEAAPPPGYPATCAHVFSREETALLRDAARNLNVTLNDLLMRDVFLALGEWRVRHGVRDDAGWLRMMVPMNMRARGDRVLSAVNAVGAVFVDRRGQDFGDPDRLLRGLSEELQLIKRNKLGLVFIHFLRALQTVPGGLKLPTRNNKCRVSTIFTNIGKPMLRSPLPREEGRCLAGELVLEQIDGAAPLFPHNCVTFTASRYGGRLTMNLHYDPRPVTSALAEDLLATFARRVRSTIGRDA